MKTRAYANFNELVFEERNRGYGAYVLRKQYEDNLIVGLIFGVTFIGAILSAPTIYAHFKGDIVIDNSIKHHDPTVKMIDLDKDKTITPPLEKFESSSGDSGPKETLANLVPVIVETTDQNLNITDDFENAQPSAVNGHGGDGLDFLPGNGGTGTDIIEMDGDKGRVHDFVTLEQKPEYPGGDEEMYKFLRDNIEYPERAKMLGITGIVYVSFVINEFGGIGSITLERGIGGGCNDEALRVIKKMPRWKPGKQGGHPVKVKYQIPIQFDMN